MFSLVKAVSDDLVSAVKKTVFALGFTNALS